MLNKIFSLLKIIYAARNDSGLCVRGYPFGLAQLSPSLCVIRRTLHNSVLLNGAGQGQPIVTVDDSCSSYEASELHNYKWSQVSKRLLTDDTDQPVLLRRPISDIAFDTLGVIPI